MTTTNATDLITHHKIDLTLTRGEWHMMGFHETNGLLYADFHMNQQLENACLLVAAASDTPAATYVSAIAEHQHSVATCRAIANLAEAISQHATAIQKGEVQDAVYRILQQLTARTQWAVRSQLKGTGLLPRS